MRRFFRLLQVGLGPLGVRIAGDVMRRGVGEVVAAIDPAYAGRALSELVPGAPAAARVVGRIDDLSEAVDAALVCTVSDLPGCAPTLRALLSRGISVVSSCEELSYPWDRHPALAAELQQLARAKGAHLIGTGVNPGFVMDALPVAITTVCQEVRRVEVHRVQDASIRRIPFQQKIGATLTVDEFDRRVKAGSVRHVGLSESVGMIAAALGLHVDRVDETIGPVIADKAMTCALGPIEVGQVRGVHQEAHALHGQREVIALIFQAAIGEPAPHDRVIVDGEPPLELTIPGGVHGDIATSAIVINTLAGLLEKNPAPDLHSMSSVALSGCAPRRAR